MIERSQIPTVARIRPITAKAAAIDIRSGYGNHVCGPFGTRIVLGGYLEGRLRCAVIGLLYDDDTGATRHGPRNAQRQFVSLRAAAAEHGNVQVAWQVPEQALGIVNHVFMQITRVRIQAAKLFTNRLDHARMTMTDVRHIVIHVEKTTAVNVGQPHTFAADDVQRFVVKQAVGRPECCAAPVEQVTGRTARWR